MKRLGTVLTLAAALTAIYVARDSRGLRPRPPSGWRVADILRDAPNDPLPGDLAQRHAVLARDLGSSCALCHPVQQSAAMRALWSSAQSAGASDLATPLDYRTPTSKVCLSCHDGASGGGYMLAFANIKGNHPIGMDYRAAWLADPMSYQPPGANTSIRLENGKVGCASCHRLHERTIERAGVARDVCRSCHRK